MNGPVFIDYRGRRRANIVGQAPARIVRQGGQTDISVFVDDITVAPIVRPTATVVVADTALTAGETSGVTFTFSQAVTGFTNADLTIDNSTLTAVTSGDGGTTRTAIFTPTAGINDTSNLISPPPGRERPLRQIHATHRIVFLTFQRP